MSAKISDINHVGGKPTFEVTFTWEMKKTVRIEADSDIAASDLLIQAVRRGEEPKDGTRVPNSVKVWAVRKTGD